MSRLILLFVIIFVFFSDNLMAQISLAPPVLYLDETSQGTGSMRIISTSDSPREVSVSFKFGYYDFDSLGNAYLRYDDTIAAQKYSLEPYIHAFPQKLVIPPKDNQLIRFLLALPPEAPDGIYWTRIIVGSKELQSQIDTTKNSRLNVGLLINTEVVGVILYKKGEPKTGLSISKIHPGFEDNKVNLSFDFDRTGSSPAWGSIYMVTYNTETGQPVDTLYKKLHVYFSGTQKFSFDKSKYVNGKYRAEYTINDEREDIPEDFRVEFATLQGKIEFEVPK